MNKTIYTFWLGDEQKKQSLIKKCNEINKYIQPWKIIIGPSDYEHNYLLKNNKYYKKAYNKKIYALCSDVWRVYIIYQNGGIYIDSGCDFNLNKINDFLKNIENYDYAFVLERPYFLWNGFFYVKHKNWRGLEKTYKLLNKLSYLSFDHTISGPIILSNVVFKELGFKIENNSNIKLMKSFEFNKANLDNVFYMNPSASWWNNVNTKIKRNYTPEEGWIKSYNSFKKVDSTFQLKFKRFIHCNFFIAWLYTFNFFNKIGNKLFNAK